MSQPDWVWGPPREKGVTGGSSGQVFLVSGLDWALLSKRWRWFSPITAPWDTWELSEPSFPTPTPPPQPPGPHLSREQLLAEQVSQVTCVCTLPGHCSGHFVQAHLPLHSRRSLPNRVPVR